VALLAVRIVIPPDLQGAKQTGDGQRPAFDQSLPIENRII